MGSLEELPSYNLARSHEEYELLVAAGCLTIGQVLESDPTALFVAASKYGVPARYIQSIKEVAKFHGLEVTAAPASVTGIKPYIPPSKGTPKLNHTNDPEREAMVKKLLN